MEVAQLSWPHFPSLSPPPFFFVCLLKWGLSSLQSRLADIRCRASNLVILREGDIHITTILFVYCTSTCLFATRSHEDEEKEEKARRVSERSTNEFLVPRSHPLFSSRLCGKIIIIKWNFPSFATMSATLTGEISLRIELTSAAAAVAVARGNVRFECVHNRQAKYGLQGLFG